MADKKKKETTHEEMTTRQKQAAKSVIGNDFTDAQFKQFQRLYPNLFKSNRSAAARQQLAALIGRDVSDKDVRLLKSAFGQNLSERNLNEYIDRITQDSLDSEKVRSTKEEAQQQTAEQAPGYQQPLPNQTTPYFRPDLPNPQNWRVYPSDPLYQGASSGLGGMLGFDPNTGRFNLASGAAAGGQTSLLAGPGNAFSPQELQGLQSLALQRVRDQQKGLLAGAAEAAAARGTVGMSPGVVANAALDASARNSLANAGLEANLQGKQLGLQQYGARQQTAGMLGDIANVNQTQMYNKFIGDKSNAFNEYTQDKQAMNTFMNNWLQQMATKGYGTGAPGKAVKDEANKQYQKLRDTMRASQARYSSYM